MARRHAAKPSFAVASLELSRDIYGFTVRPQHLKRYREYADIYKVEEAERSERWDHFLKSYDVVSEEDLALDCDEEQQEGKEAAAGAETIVRIENRINDLRTLQTWNPIRHSLLPVERALSVHIKKGGRIAFASVPPQKPADHFEATDLQSGTSAESLKDGLLSKFPEGIEDDSEEEFYDVERSDAVQDGIQFEILAANNAAISDRGLDSAESLNESSSPLTQELEALVREGVPMALRGELWQVFVGTRMRRIKGHYNALLTLLADGGGDSDGLGGLCSSSVTSSNYTLSDSGILEKWTSQIEKDLPRTFPGHPALDEDGRNALRRLLTAYARHNPDVGYCQAMNFFAALLLLMMPEENAFWTLTGIIDDYFEGYYSEKMVEAQVDQLVFDELVRVHFPKLVSHLDTLGVQVAWVSGPWFLSIFVNILPWESVLRVWDVLLYEGNRSMLFRTALALIELHGPAIMATKDAGDAVTLLQSLAGATFDSSQLVLVACMGYQMVDEAKLQELQTKNRPKVMAALMERSLELHVWRSSHSPLTSKLHHYTNGPGLNGGPSDNIGCGSVNGIASTGDVSEHVVATEFPEKNVTSVSNKEGGNGSSRFEAGIVPQNVIDSSSDILDDKEGNATDLLEQVKWLKTELCRVLEENRAARLRAEELETAFMELVQEDNRRLLSAKVETLEAEVVALKQSLAEKEEQEQAMVQVVLRMEQEQRLTEDARRFAEQDATAQRHAVHVLQEKYEGASIALAEMEKRAVMAESMLEATLQYQALGSGQTLSRRVVDSSMREEEPSKRLWSRMPFSPKTADSDGSTTGAVTSSPHKQDMGELSRLGINKINHLQLGDPRRKQGLLSRPFALPWRDKGKTGVHELQSPISPIIHQNQPEATSTSVSPLNIFDSSSQDYMHYRHDASVSEEATHLNGSLTSTEADSEEIDHTRVLADSRMIDSQ